MMKKRKHEVKEHMCDLVAREAGLRELKAAVRGAKYVCAGCGRSAKRAERLCLPEPL